MPGGCVLLDFSGVYRMMRTPPGTLVDCRGIEGTSCYCDAAAAEEIARRHGYRPYLDMPIVFTGIRPGEKLEEDLGVEVPGAKRTAHGKIFALGGSPVTQKELDAVAARAREICASEMPDGEVRAAVLALVRPGS